MAQEPGQQSVQTVKIRKYFRETEYGGFDRTWIISAGGQFIRPAVSERSKSGRHGWDIWQLPAGKYAIISQSP